MIYGLNVIGDYPVAVDDFPPGTDFTAVDYPTGAVLSFKATNPRQANLSFTSTATITFAGAVGKPTVIIATSSAAIAIAGGIGALTSQTISPQASFVFAGTSLSTFVGSTINPAQFVISGNLGGLVGYSQCPSANINLSSAVPEILGAVVSPSASITFSGAPGTVVVLTKPPFATLWFAPGILLDVQETSEGTVVVINANTLAVSEYSIAALDVVEFDGELYFVKSAELSKLDDSAFYDAGYIQTGQIDFGSTTGKRCTAIELDTTVSSPEVYLVDQNLTEYATALRAGAGTKRKREYNAPRGVLSNRFGFKISGDYIDIDGIKVSISDSARK